MNVSTIILQCAGPDDVLLPRILSFLSWDELIVNIRLVNHAWKQAVTYTPASSFSIPMTSRGRNADHRQLRTILTRLPRLQKIVGRCKNGLPEDTVCLIIEGFKELKSLDISAADEPQEPAAVLLDDAMIYAPNLMESISSTWQDCLLELDVSHNAKVEMNLKLLSRLQKLRILNASGCPNINGNLSSLAVLSSKLQVCDLQDCPLVQGHVRDLATACPKLFYLGLRGTNVQGRLSDLQNGDFASLIYMDWIHGGSMEEQQEAQESIGVDMEGHICGMFLGKDLAFVSSAPRAVHRAFDLAQSLPSLRLDLCSFHLSKESPDYYSKPNRSSNGLWSLQPPFQVELLCAQGRRGWRWTNGTKKGVCEIQWLDPLPDFATKKQHVYYQLELKLLPAGSNDDSIYQGLSGPPTEEEHNDLMYKKLIQKRRRARQQQRDEEG